MKRIPEQIDFRPELPLIIGNKDYQKFKMLLRGIDCLLIESGIEEIFVETQLLKRHFRSVENQIRFQKKLRVALRCNIGRWLTEKEYRKFSRRLADSPLLQWFCGINQIDQVEVPSKSELCRFDKMASAKEVKTLMDELNQYALNIKNPLKLKTPLNLEACFSDTTCKRAYSSKSLER